MDLLTSIPQIFLELHLTPTPAGPPETRARQLRGAIAAAFPGESLFHQHDPDGRVVYRYPRVQFRWRADTPIVYGWGEAVERLIRLPWLDLSLQLGTETFRVLDVAISTERASIAVSERLLHYSLLSPALLFNQKNYAAYRSLDEAGRRTEQDRLLVANLLTVLRGLEVNFPQRLYAVFTQSANRPCRYKEQDLLGVNGSFVANVLLPSGIGIGHAASHGFGWVEPVP